MKVTFVLSVHLPYDERVYFHQKMALEKIGYEVSIISMMNNSCKENDIFTLNKDNATHLDIRKQVNTILCKLTPDVIICDTPIAIWYCLKYKKQQKKQLRIIYDVTEYYPSKKNVLGLSFFKKAIKNTLLNILKRYTCKRTDGFIYGEYYKFDANRAITKNKPFIFTSYYPNLEDIIPYPIRSLKDECIFFYAGHPNKDKGYDKVLEVITKCAENNPATQFILRTVLYSSPSSNVQLPANATIEQLPFLPYLEFAAELGKVDICLDLREIDTENNCCLPIKLFYFMGCGRAFIISDLKAIRKEVPEATEAGKLINPNNSEEIVSIVEKFIHDFPYYASHCERGLELAHKKYNWHAIESSFTQFILGNG